MLVFNTKHMKRLMKYITALQLPKSILLQRVAQHSLTKFSTLWHLAPDSLAQLACLYVKPILILCLMCLEQVCQPEVRRDVCCRGVKLISSIHSM